MSLDKNKKIIVIAGPTASGKTSLAVSLAKKLNCSIISADSRQFYKEIAIGTAKPTLEEQEGIPHFFIDSHSIHTPLSAGKYEQEALEKVKELFEKDDFIIVVGGSGMFIDALIYGTDQIPHDEKVREFWNKEYEEKGIEYLQDKLKVVDYAYYQEIDIHNPMRLIRALEVYDIMKIPYSELRKTQKKESKFNVFYFVLDFPRGILYDRINRRVDSMLENGLIEEAQENYKFRELQPLNTVGYKELFDFFEKKINQERAIELIKQNSRRYAKRQLTWFRKNKEAIWLHPEENKDLAKQILELILDTKTS